MKFWKLLAWSCTVGFLLVLAMSWFANDHHSAAPPDVKNEPPPAPRFH